MQLGLFTRTAHRDLPRMEHGGAVRMGRRKLERPVSVRRPMHVTLHSERARGAWSLRRHRLAVREALSACSRRTGIVVYDFANVGSHLHLLVRARRRPDLQTFLRSFSGLVARIVTGAQKGRPLNGRFWTALAWSRVVSWLRFDHISKKVGISRIDQMFGGHDLQGHRLRSDVGVRNLWWGEARRSASD
jgi:hypothetical protein